jgi:hypothetical protein
MASGSQRKRFQLLKGQEIAFYVSPFDSVDGGRRFRAGSGQLGRRLSPLPQVLFGSRAVQRMQRSL